MLEKCQFQPIASFHTEILPKLLVFRPDELPVKLSRLIGRMEDWFRDGEILLCWIHIKQVSYL